jgi:acetoin utilization deacetylase AcuC-like enzyme
LRRRGLRRALIFDWDVHHGNGTQDIFEADPDVYFFSCHQWPLYPGTGAASERGTGPGTGTTFNLPLKEGTGVEAVFAVMDGPFAAAMDEFRPEIVFISAGFDARVDDPLGGLNWTDDDFGALTDRLVAFAEKYASGRLVSVLEGGYNPAGLAKAVETHVRRLGRPA